jgi:hypothetical protein
MRYELREFCTAQQLLAHRILDDVAAGQDVSLERTNWALRILGESIG